MQQIEHNPKERRPTNAIWWILWPLIALMWGWYMYFVGENWIGVMLGFLTGGVLATWAIEITGNKLPDWMK